MKDKILYKITKSFCSVKSVLTLMFGIALIIFTSKGIIDGEKFLSIATLLIGSLVGAAGKNSAIEKETAPQQIQKDPDSAASIGEEE